MIKISPYIFLLLALSGCAQSLIKTESGKNSLDYAKPSKVGMIADSLELVEPFVQKFIDSSYLAGAVVMVSKNNKIVYTNTIGHFNRGKTQAIKEDDIFRIASMTKPIITVAAMQLYEQGKLDVNDPVSKYIPGFREMKIVENFNKKDSSYTTRPAEKEITIHHLLTQTSGLAYGIFHPIAGPVYAPFRVTETWSKDSLSLEMNVKQIAQLPLLHEPGEQFTYGINTEVLARIVEIASGMPLDKYLEEKIYKPLGMNDTYFFLPEEKAHRLVEVWYRGDRKAADFPESFRDDYPVKDHKMYFSGGGGISSTAPDYMKFANTLLNKGSLNGVRILKKETVEKMMSNQIGSVSLEKGVQFGYGAALHTEDGAFNRKKGRYSWGGFWLTNFWIDPARNMVVVVISNAFDTPRFDPYFNGLDAIVNSAVVKE
jgi:CubicO group peptidase (beta-lactamase class C family)